MERAIAAGDVWCDRKLRAMVSSEQSTKIESDCSWHKLSCDLGIGALKKEELGQIYP